MTWVDEFIIKLPKIGKKTRQKCTKLGYSSAICLNRVGNWNCGLWKTPMTPWFVTVSDILSNTVACKKIWPALNKKEIDEYTKQMTNDTSQALRVGWI